MTLVIELPDGATKEIEVPDEFAIHLFVVDYDAKRGRAIATLKVTGGEVRGLHLGSSKRP